MKVRRKEGKIEDLNVALGHVTGASRGALSSYSQHVATKNERGDL